MLSKKQSSFPAQDLCAKTPLCPCLTAEDNMSVNRDAILETDHFPNIHMLIITMRAAARGDLGA